MFIHHTSKALILGLRILVMKEIQCQIAFVYICLTLMEVLSWFDTLKKKVIYNYAEIRI